LIIITGPTAQDSCLQRWNDFIDFLTAFWIYFCSPFLVLFLFIDY